MNEQDKPSKQDLYILDCARELIKAIKDSGRDLAFKHDGEVKIPVFLSVYVFSDNELKVDNINNGWEVRGDYVEL